MSEQKVIVTLPADQEQTDHTGYVFTFRDEAPEPDRVWEGALIVAGDEDNPFVARVVEIVPKVGRELVHLEPLCVPEDGSAMYGPPGPDPSPEESTPWPPTPARPAG